MCAELAPKLARCCNIWVANAAGAKGFPRKQGKTKSPLGSLCVRLGDVQLPFAAFLGKSWLGGGGFCLAPSWCSSPPLPCLMDKAFSSACCLLLPGRDGGQKDEGEEKEGGKKKPRAGSWDPAGRFLHRLLSCESSEAGVGLWVAKCRLWGGRWAFPPPPFLGFSLSADEIVILSLGVGLFLAGGGSLRCWALWFSEA